MMASDLTIWLVIVTLGVGTFLLRWSFLGAIGTRQLPSWAQRALRYTAVAVLPALVAPLVVWPAATGGQPDPARLTAAGVTLVVGYLTRNLLYAVIAGMVTLFGTLYLWA
ncbi:AzlD domain-containing protein [Paracoccus shanxieyensis]|uniref:AzlD domain-containing protein n=1 Tax=Paracoccus shanxieyensis TaxID=2675752 RepID=A0A6L6IWY3_9RHOB|nr:AzlD domain-containing protein [Paracoccus shanxieyensis]MTH62867.1 AzlD domain-containing protein [Paracoccus shanxieyensis]MTH86049.1 AzlD domain-containing protein [Paracoccus shanxieyensis]